MFSRESFIMEWPVYEGYEIISGGNIEQDTASYIRPISGIICNRYNPMLSEELFTAIQKVDENSIDSIFRFVSRFGLLVHGFREADKRPYYVTNVTYDDFKEDINFIADQIALYKFLLKTQASIDGDKTFINQQLRNEKTSRIFQTHIPWILSDRAEGYKQEEIYGIKAYFTPQVTFYYPADLDNINWNTTPKEQIAYAAAKGWVSVTVTDKIKGISFFPRPVTAGYKSTIRIEALLDILYLKVHLDITNPKVKYKVCQNERCNAVFAAGIGANRREDALFCSNNCLNAKKQRKWKKKPKGQQVNSNGNAGED